MGGKRSSVNDNRRRWTSSAKLEEDGTSQGLELLDFSNSEHQGESHNGPKSLTDSSSKPIADLVTNRPRLLVATRILVLLVAAAVAAVFSLWLQASASQPQGSALLGTSGVYVPDAEVTSSSRPGPKTTVSQTARAPAVTASQAQILVHVVGAVRRPGVVKLKPGDRIDQAVQAAGGAMPNASLESINMAAPAVDGSQIRVLTKDELLQVNHGTGSSAMNEGQLGANTPNVSQIPGGAAASAGASVNALLNINSATLGQLDALNGIGPVTAQRILDYREQHGGFKSIEELDAVDGIGPKLFASLKTQVTVG